MRAAATTDNAEARRKREYHRLGELFLAMLKNLDNKEKREAALLELAAFRSSIMIIYATEAFKMDAEEVESLLRSGDDNGLAKRDTERRDRLVKAVENIIEFCVCAEYQLLLASLDGDDWEGVDFAGYDRPIPGEGEVDESDPLLPWWRENEKYNGHWRRIEEEDAAYAMVVCERWLNCRDTEYLTYMTQNDDRVRPWHYALQGFSAPKKDFPGWLIPPIEWACRCYLVTEGGSALVGGKVDVRSVRASVKVPVKPKELDGVFSESICQGGRIFGASHPYFDIRKGDGATVRRIVKAIKKRWWIK